MDQKLPKVVQICICLENILKNHPHWCGKSSLRYYVVESDCDGKQMFALVRSGIVVGIAIT